VRACGVVAKVHRTWPRATSAFAALGLLRLLVLREDCVGPLTSRGSGGEGVGVLWDVLDTVTGAAPPSTASPVPAGSAGAAPSAAEVERLMYGSHAANVMALTTLANAFKCPAGAAWAARGSELTRLIDALARILSAPSTAPAGAAATSAPALLARADLRQMAAALAYNVANAMPVGSETVSGSPAGGAMHGSTVEGDATVLVTDASVQLLGALLEGVGEEADPEAARRRLLAAGRLLLREGAAAGELALTLGMNEPVERIAGDSGRQGPVRLLAKEVAALMRPASPAI
jgi:hypothetical protein